VSEPAARRIVRAGNANSATRLARLAEPSPPPSPESRHTRIAGTNQHIDQTAETVPHWLRTAGGWSWRFVAVIVALGLLIFGLVQRLPVFIAVFIALVLTSVLNPLTTALDRRIPRGLAVILSLLSVIVVVGGLLAYVIASVATQWEGLTKQFSRGVEQIITWLNGPPLSLNVGYTGLADLITAGQKWVTDHTQQIATEAANRIGTVTQTIFVIALALFLTVFFLGSGRSMWTWFLGQLPRRARSHWADAAENGWRTFAGYARGIVIIAFIDATLAAILLTAARVPLAAPLAVVVFIGAFIPIVGAPAAMIICGIVALAANGPITALIVVLGTAGIGQLDGHIFQPLIMGKQVRLHPVVIAVGVASGTFIAGVVGAVLAVPVMAVTWSVYSTLRKRTGPVGSGLSPKP
jgi:predicted PurR-regulated permease PerM